MIEKTAQREPRNGASLWDAASLALMCVVTYQLGRATIIDIPTIILALASAIAIFRFHFNSAWLILCGAVLGLLLSGFK